MKANRGKTVTCVIGFAAILVASPTTSVAAPNRAPETCHGLTATITGTPGSMVTGTPGNDVIVTNGAFKVRAAEGDDTICVTGSDQNLVVDAGPGADHIDLTGLTSTAAGIDQTAPTHTVAPGDGADTILGSAGDEYVPLNGTGPDTVNLGDGADNVSAGADLLDDGTAINLGEGDDTFNVFDGLYGSLDFPSTPTDTQPVTGAGPLQLDGGPGDNQMTLDEPSRYAINAKRQTVTAGQHRIAYRHIDSYVLYAGASKARAFVGSSRDESFAYVGGLVRSITMGGGDDTVTILTPEPKAKTLGSINGGPGANTLEAQQLTKGVTSVVNLTTGKFTARNRLVASFRQFQDATVVGVGRLIGTNGPNTLTWNVCRPVTIDAAGGNDVLRPAPETAPGSCGKPATLLGGSGADRITAGPGNDYISGGAGRDRADGADGRDKCVGVERARNCEKQ